MGRIEAGVRGGACPGEIGVGLCVRSHVVSRWQVAYYASGERPVPRTVLPACKGWEVERQGAAA